MQVGEEGWHDDEHANEKAKEGLTIAKLLAGWIEVQASQVGGVLMPD